MPHAPNAGQITLKGDESALHTYADGMDTSDANFATVTP
jgi:hypothetical protein